MVGRTKRPLGGRIKAASAVLAVVALAASWSPGAASAATTGGTGSGKQGGCPALPTNLTSAGGAAGFTMLIRINNDTNVTTYTKPVSEGGLAGHIRAQDIFVVNTRFQNTAGTSNPAVAAQLVTDLRAKFPCNRIIALNGVSADATQPGYLYALANEVTFATLLDFEPDDWNLALAGNPGLGPWSFDFPTALGRVFSTTAGLSSALANTPGGLYTRAGLAPMDVSSWNYGQFQQRLDINNRRLGSLHAGVQSVQTQESCMKGAATFAARFKALRFTFKFRYKFKKKKVRKGKKIVKRKVRRKVKIKKKAQPNLNNLAMQISFSDTPNPSDPLPVRNVSAATADSCVAAGLAVGQASYFFFASDDAMRMLFAQPTMAGLRPPV